MKSLQNGLRGKINVSKSQGGKGVDIQLLRRYDHIKEQIKSDIVLLENINKEAKGISMSSNTGEFLRNVIVNELSGKTNTIKKLENDLMVRVQLVTAFMMKDVWKVLPLLYN